MATKRLIVNADDFGLSAGINKECGRSREGNSDQRQSDGALARSNSSCEVRLNHPELSIGLHLDLGEWTFDQEEWRLAYEVVRGRGSGKRGD